MERNSEAQGLGRWDGGKWEVEPSGADSHGPSSYLGTGQGTGSAAHSKARGSLGLKAEAWAGRARGCAQHHCPPRCSRLLSDRSGVRGAHGL